MKITNAFDHYQVATTYAYQGTPDIPMVLHHLRKGLAWIDRTGKDVALRSDFVAAITQYEAMA